MPETASAPPPQAGGSRRLVTTVVVLGVLGGGYYVWKHYKDTGEIVGMDAKESKAFVARAKELKDRAAAKAGALLAESREVFQKRKADLEVWFKERDIKVPTREELVAIADKYRKGSDEKDAPPVSSPRRRRERRSSAPEESPRTRPAAASGSASSSSRTTSRSETSRTETSRSETTHRETTRVEEAPEGDPYVLGRREFDRAFRHWKNARPASADEQSELKTARKHFATARDHFERAKELDPDDAKIDELLTDCNRFLYDCMKRTILDVY